MTMYQMASGTTITRPSMQGMTFVWQARRELQMNTRFL